jgi:uncharacterized protein YjbI with pentapeptide repeats
MTNAVEKGCECEWLEDRTCNEPFYKEFNGRPYCVLHFPDVGKKEGFQIAFERRLDPDNENYLNFVGLWFPDLVSFLQESFSFIADFTAARFTAGAKFSGCEFLQARFANAHFDGFADFTQARFEGIADFSGARFQKKVTFSRANFTTEGRFFRTHFEGFADFAGVQIEGEAWFNEAVFDYAYFGLARIRAPEIKAKPTDTSQFEFYRSKFTSAHFSRATFVRCDFNQACFAQSVSFFYAQSKEFSDFSSVDFNKANFGNSQLAHPNFDGSFFLTAPNFNQSQMYGNTNFATARVPGADFSEVTFHGPVDFTLTRFEQDLAEWERQKLQECNIRIEARDEPIVIQFDRSTFKDGLTFKGNQLYQDRSLLSFDDAFFEKPDRVRFVSVSMPPHSFMNVDPRKFNLIDTRWGFIDKPSALKEANLAMQRFGRSASGPILELAYRQLAVNAEENNRYEQAADLRYLAMEVARSMRWRRVDWLRLSWWYWLLSGYGERVRRAFGVLLVIWLLFGLIYWKAADESWWQPKQPSAILSVKPDATRATPIKLTASDALLYSAGVMALQKPEPAPANKRAKLLVLMETIFGPVQVALLALAIRRKFMR